ncbi:MAG: DUF2071 domain-containing protein [Planctomycetota bacterium]|nr:DUF2071 domain-containing protein [Planctomycetota bacterium]
MASPAARTDTASRDNRSLLFDESQMIDRPGPSRRPTEKPTGYQCWSDLLFAHWRVSPELLRPLVPAGLELDTFDGDAWLGVVPFHMSGVRPWWAPALPGISEFHETNLRTYVHFRGRDPGVLFISLDAACRPVVEVARWKWKLNYYYAQMKLLRNGDEVHYSSLRTDGRSPRRAEVDITARIGEPLNPEPGTSVEPGTLEHFLAERYVLYVDDRRGGLMTGRVHHTPYPLRSVEVVSCRQTLSSAAEVPVPGQPDHALFSEGVTVDIFPLRRVRL